MVAHTFVEELRRLRGEFEVVFEVPFEGSCTRPKLRSCLGGWVAGIEHSPEVESCIARVFLAAVVEVVVHTIAVWAAGRASAPRGLRLRLARTVAAEIARRSPSAGCTLAAVMPLAPAELSFAAAAKDSLLVVPKDRSLPRSAAVLIVA